jgi:phosphoglycerate dehydrogenase-like enzyme
MSARIVYIGAPEVPAALFQRRVQADFGGLDLLASDDRQAAVRELATTEVLIGHHFHFDEAVLASAPRLRWIQSLTSGTDAILKLRNLPREVIVTNTRGMHGPQVSELVFLQMLALLRDFPRMQRNQTAARWERWPQPLLLGKTVVIVGVGAIAEALALRCKAFGMTVHGVSGRSGQLEHFDGLHDYDRLAYAASLADFLVLLVPLSPATEKLADAQVIAAMKPGAYLINVARGGVLDEDALLLALRERRLAGAALDVYRTTPLPAEHPLWREPRVVLTPHIGGMSDIYFEQAYPVVRDNLRRYLDGRPEALINVVAH